MDDGLSMITTHKKKAGLLCALSVLILGFLSTPITWAADEAADHAATPEVNHEADDHGHASGDHGDDAHGGNSNPLSIDPDLAVFTLIVFILLMLVLKKAAWGPIMTGLAAREDGIAANIEQAQQDAEAAAEKLREYEQQLSAAAEEARSIISKAQEDAQATADTIVAEAQEAAQRQRDRALADIETAKNVALGEVAEKSVDIALGLAGNIVRRQLTAAEHSELIRDTLEKFPSSN